MKIYRSTHPNHDRFWNAWSRNSFIINDSFQEENRNFWFGERQVVNPWNFITNNYCEVDQTELLFLISSIEENLYWLNQWLAPLTDRYEDLINSL